jgi:glucose-6-phosphate dehydrogenase assembly protein OpcA
LFVQREEDSTTVSGKDERMNEAPFSFTREGAQIVWQRTVQWKELAIQLLLQPQFRREGEEWFLMRSKSTDASSRRTHTFLSS